MEDERFSWNLLWYSEFDSKDQIFILGVRNDKNPIDLVFNRW